MKPGRYNITIKQGTAYKPSAFIFTDSVGAVDLTGSTVTAQVRDLSSGAKLADFVVTTTPLTGSIQLYLSDDITGAIVASGQTFNEKTTYAWDLFISPPSGDSYCLLEGSFFVIPRATK